MKRYSWLLFLILFACEKPELDLKSQMLNFPAAEPVAEIIRLNPDLIFLRVRIGSQVRIAAPLVPDRDLKIETASKNRIKFYYGALPSYFQKHPGPIHLQALSRSRGLERVIWTSELSAQKIPIWQTGEAALPELTDEVIFRSDLKDYGLALTAPRLYPAPPDPRPSIIFILIDALRADHLGAYGYSRETSPNLDELARSGSIFMNTMSASSFTVTSLSSMFTGLWPWEHRSLFASNLILSDEITTLAERMREAGYQTAGFSATYFRLSDFNLDRGFELFNEDCDARFFINDAECVTEKATNWLDRDGEEPFFLYLHYVSTHAPYYPPAQYQKIFSSGLKRPKGTVGMGDIQPFGDNRQWYQIPRAPRPDELDWLVSQYDGEIRYADTEIGKLLARVSELGLRDKTLILVTGDHGEAFFEHQKMDHTEENHWQVMHIPLILSGPGIPVGKKIEPLIRSVDFAPFLLEYGKAGMLSGISGKSLEPLLTGTESEQRIGYSIRYYNLKKYQIAAVQWPYNFLIWRPADKKIELYNLEDDSAAQKNLADQSSDLVRRFFSLLPDPVLIQSGPAVKQGQLSPEVQKRLKALHYTK